MRQNIRTVPDTYLLPEEWLKDKDGVNLANTKKGSGDTVYVPYYNLHKVLAGADWM